MKRKYDRSKQTTMTQHQPVGKREWIKIKGRSFEVLERLSVPNRGRWKLRDPEPAPRGTLLTAIILPDSAEANQLRKSVARIPQSHHSLPRLVIGESKNGKTTIVVSYCHGTNLRDYMEKFNEQDQWPISVWEAVRRIKSLAHSISVIHDYCQVIHGDVKPENLILPSDPGSLIPIDFGSSWQLEKTASRKIGDGSNPFYSCPDLFRESSRVNGSADQFSVAVVLFEMLTGELPYGGLGGKAGHAGFEEAIKSYRPPCEHIGNDCQIPNSILNSLDVVVTRALKIDPAKRFSNMRTFAKELGYVFSELQSKANRGDDNETFFQTLKRWIVKPRSRD